MVCVVIVVIYPVKPTVHTKMNLPFR